MINTVDFIRKEATAKLNQAKRSGLGQYLTSDILAHFIASFFSIDNQKESHLLDAGAGVGSLTAAFLERKCTGWGNSKDITVTVYEIDPLLMEYLVENMENYQKKLKLSGITLTTDFRFLDFIDDTVFKIQLGSDQLFTHAILNPPYKKMNSASKHRQLLSQVGIETVNLYSAFVALAIMQLKNGGELVAIIPRSFCNGNYYKSFRTLIAQETAIRRLHLFKSRHDAFKDDEVLQENIIIHLVKNGIQGDVLISHSSDAGLEDLDVATYPYEQIVKPTDAEGFIHIPAIEDNEIELSDKISYTLSDLEIKVSTGPVVDFRSQEHIFMDPGPNMVPLIYPMHFNGTGIEWPKTGKKPNAISLNPETQKMLFPAGFYTVVKRFSSKEEKQRIVARVIDPKKLKSDFIGLENHLNVFHFEKKGIDESLAYGLAAFLNSGLVDTHFRSFNGHTQVNATDLKQMKYPSKAALIELGRWAKEKASFIPEEMDTQIRLIL